MCACGVQWTRCPDAEEAQRAAGNDGQPPAALPRAARNELTTT
jgi:hypothetical protein